MARRMFACSNCSNCHLLPPLSTISPSLSSTHGSYGTGTAGAPVPAGAVREVTDIPLVCQQRREVARDGGPGTVMPGRVCRSGAPPVRLHAATTRPGRPGRVVHGEVHVPPASRPAGRVAG